MCSAKYAFVLLLQIYSFDAFLAKELVCSKFAYEEQLLEKMIRTEIKVESMENEIKKTEDTVLNTLDEIKRTGVYINNKFEDLRNNITEDMEQKNNDILEKEEEFFKNTFEKLRTNFTNNMENQRNILSDLRENMKKVSVAFYVHHVKDLILDLTDEIIVFDQTITNEGSGYDTSTGIFTAPIGGLYQFSVHTCVYARKYSVIGLVLAGNVIAASVNYDKDTYTCSSFGAIVRVESGEQVWVKCTSGGSDYRLYESKHYMNTYSGILINK